MDSTDFWYWFLAPNEIGLDAKVAIMQSFADGEFKSVETYIKDELNLDVEVQDA